MPAGLSSPILKRLIDHVEKMGPINNNDKWLGKRTCPRILMTLPARLRLLDEAGTVQGPAFTARSRDISERGLGLTVPYHLEPLKTFQVEMFTVIGTLVGRMQTLHCTQTLGGYKLGMQWIGVPHGSDALSMQPPTSKLGLSMPPGKPQSETLTFEQALDEIRQAMRKYYVASISKGLLGLSMEREIGKVLDTLPTPEDQAAQQESRRRALRHPVEGQVHLMVSTPQGHEMSNNEIADISSGGARVLLVPPNAVESCGKPPQDMPWPHGTHITMGMWTTTGTLWLPAQVVHCDQQSPELVFAGLEFTLDKVIQDFT